MIRQHEIVSLLTNALPGFRDDHFPSQPSLRPYAAINQFTNYTRGAVNNHNHHLARRCFLLAEHLYKDGDAMVKQLIDNYFIYSFSSYWPAPESDEIRCLIPPHLYKIYVKEMINNHC